MPYCSTCAGAVTALGTRRLAAGLGSVILTLAALSLFPLVALRANMFLYALAVAGAGGFPLLLLWAIRRRPAGERSSEGRALWWSRDGIVSCTHESWAKQLAALNGTHAGQERGREPILTLLTSMAAVIGLACTPAAYGYLYPRLVVLNLNEQRLTIATGGSVLGTVAPSSLESSEEGLRVRLPLGATRLVVTDELGNALGEYPAYLKAGHDHFFAPASAGYCFWLEENVYGRSAARSEPERRRKQLDPGREFWVLPTAIDTWFGANPAGIADLRSSGGQMVALRHGRCDTPEGL